MMRPNPIDVIEAAYELERDERDWRTNLARVVRPLLDGGHGLAVFTYAGGAPNIDDLILIDMTRERFQEIVAVTARAPEVTPELIAHPQALSSSSEASRQLGYDFDEVPEVISYQQRIGLRDSLQLTTVEPGGNGLIVFAPQAERVRVDARARRLWAQVSVHIAAARRLREVANDDEAILTPSGRLEDARGEAKARSARETLREAVLRVEKARGRARREDPMRATEAWTALVSGRWSLVDRFEKNGRRFLVARPNLHALRDPRALSARERAVAHLAALGKSNKLIAYELGLAESTIATHLSSALRKLGVRSRVELVRLIAQFGLGPPP